MTSHLTASVVLLQPLVRYASKHGKDLGTLLSQFGADPALLRDPDGRVPDQVLQRAWSELARSTHDEALGIHFAQARQEGDYGVLEYAVSFSSTLRDAVDRIARFYRLVADSAAVEIIDDGKVIRVRRRVAGTCPQEQDGFFAVVWSVLRNLAGHPVHPAEVRFEHPRSGKGALSRYFGCPVRFDQPCSEMVFAAWTLAQAARAPRPKLAALLDRYAADLLARLPKTASYAAHVRHAIAHVMHHHGAPTLDALARYMHSSPRTVQRRLAEVHTTPKRLVDDVRHELALRYLTSPKLSLTEIAYLLGFQEESSFRRSFKRWTGKSPTRARLS